MCKEEGSLYFMHFYIGTALGGEEVETDSTTSESFLIILLGYN